MAITVTKQARSCKMRYRPGGGTLEETYAVLGLNPAEDSNYVLAVAQVNAQVPGTAYQAPHPKVQGMSVMGFDTDVMGTEESPNKSGVWVTVIYGTPDYLPANYTAIEISGMNGTRILNRWPYGPIQGKPIMIGLALDHTTNKLSGGKFSPFIDVGALAPSDASTDIMYDTVEIAVPSSATQLCFTRREPNPPAIGTYRNKISSTQWQGLAAGLWFCYQITSRNIPPGTLGLAGWETKYTFITGEDISLPSPLNGFTRVCFFRDQHTGKQVIGANPADGTNNGYTIVQPFASVDFNALNLPNVY